MIERVDELSHGMIVAQDVEARGQVFPDYSSKEPAQIIETDAVLTMRALRLVNSGSYGFSQETSTVEQAAIILGYKQVRAVYADLESIEHLFAVMTE